MSSQTCTTRRPGTVARRLGTVFHCPYTILSCHCSFTALSLSFRCPFPISTVMALSSHFFFHCHSTSLSVHCHSAVLSLHCLCEDINLARTFPAGGATYTSSSTVRRGSSTVSFPTCTGQARGTAPAGPKFVRCFICCATLQHSFVLLFLVLCAVLCCSEAGR